IVRARPLTVPPDAVTATFCELGVLPPCVALNVTLVGASASVALGVTVYVTATRCGVLSAPVAATLTSAVYVPGGRFVVLGCTVTVVGAVRLLGAVTDSQLLPVT